MISLAERGRAIRERIHRFDNVSGVPTEILKDTLKSVGYSKSPRKFSRELWRKGNLGIPVSREVKEAIAKEVSKRLAQNINELPDPLQENIKDVAGIVSSFVYRNGRLGGLHGYLAYIGLDESLRESKTESVEVMKESGLIEVFPHRPRQGSPHEIWRLSKKIDPALRKISH